MEQLNLQQLIKKLESVDKSKQLITDSKHPLDCTYDSYRGYYEDLAFGYYEQNEKIIKVEDFLNSAKSAINEYIYGWKGGEYIVNLGTLVWIANDGENSGIQIVDVQEDEFIVTLITVKNKFRD